MVAGKLLSGSASGESSGFWSASSFTCSSTFSQQIFRRHAMVLHADGHIGGDLVEGRGNGVQAGDPVVVVLDGGEASWATSCG